MSEEHEEVSPEVGEQVAMFIARLRAAREARDISQMDLSFKAGLSKNLVNNIENGHNVPNLITILKICNALDIEPATLFEGTARNKAEVINAVIKYLKGML